MEDKSEYITRIQSALIQLYHCSATWRETISVRDRFGGQTVWQGNVEVFELNGHPKARRVYGWIYFEGEYDEVERVAAMLEIPPVSSALTAVRASIIATAQKRREK